MTKKLGEVGRLVFALAVVAALALGARQAFGSPPARSCDNCTSYQECVDCCGAEGSICPVVGGHCVCA